MKGNLVVVGLGGLAWPTAIASRVAGAVPAVRKPELSMHSFLISIALDSKGDVFVADAAADRMVPRLPPILYRGSTGLGGLAATLGRIRVAAEKRGAERENRAVRQCRPDRPDAGRNGG